MKLISEKEKKYSKIIFDFLEENPILSGRKIEREANVFQGTISGGKNNGYISKNQIYPLLCVLANYGLKIDGYILEFDKEKNTILGKKLVENVEVTKEFVTEKYHIMAWSSYSKLS